MSFRAQIETVLYVDNFVNIDLFFQGYYYLKFKLYYHLQDQNLVSHLKLSYSSFSVSILYPNPTTYLISLSNKPR